MGLLSGLFGAEDGGAEGGGRDGGSGSPPGGGADGAGGGGGSGGADEELVPIPMPSLIATILNAEESKGAPLTREEVEAIRDKCPCVMGPVWMIAKMAESRGYEDIDPERAWEEWQEARRSLVDGSA